MVVSRPSHTPQVSRPQGCCDVLWCSYISITKTVCGDRPYFVQRRRDSAQSSDAYRCPCATSLAGTWTQKRTPTPQLAAFGTRTSAGCLSRKTVTASARRTSQVRCGSLAVSCLRERAVRARAARASRPSRRALLSPLSLSRSPRRPDRRLDDPLPAQVLPSDRGVHGRGIPDAGRGLRLGRLARRLLHRRCGPSRVRPPLHILRQLARALRGRRDLHGRPHRAQQHHHCGADDRRGLPQLPPRTTSASHTTSGDSRPTRSSRASCRCSRRRWTARNAS